MLAPTTLAANGDGDNSKARLFFRHGIEWQCAAQNARMPVGANKLKLADIWGAAIGLPGRGKSLCHVFQGESRQTLQRLDGCRCEAE
jgi:hypothetical protein